MHSMVSVLYIRFTCTITWAFYTSSCILHSCLSGFMKNFREVLEGCWLLASLLVEICMRPLAVEASEYDLEQASN